MSGQTPSQTVGPYFAYGLAAQQYHYPHGQIVDGEIVGEGAADRIRIVGRVLDGRVEPIPDALIEFWQADSEGRYGAEGFSGFGRQGTSFPNCTAWATFTPWGIASYTGASCLSNPC